MSAARVLGDGRGDFGEDWQMNIPSSPVFSQTDFPDADPRMLEMLSRGFRQIYVASAQMPERQTSDGSFTSAASGVSTVQLKNPLPQKPAHITVALRRDDLADFAAAWSWWHAIEGTQVKLSFIGLPASVKLVYSVEFS